MPLVYGIVCIIAILTFIAIVPKITKIVYKCIKKYNKYMEDD